MKADLVPIQYDEDVSASNGSVRDMKANYGRLPAGGFHGMEDQFGQLKANRLTVAVLPLWVWHF